uniref:Uncharacterized protein n=1 Tax=Anser cygnoides TaxID=8845 RepID=A0A8B9IKJ5_ANSCY
MHKLNDIVPIAVLGSELGHGMGGIKVIFWELYLRQVGHFGAGEGIFPHRVMPSSQLGPCSRRSWEPSAWWCAGRSCAPLWQGEG